jgi:cell division protein FtsL
MHRKVNLFLLLLAVAGAFALHALKYGTRRLELHVRDQERTLEKLEGDIAVLKAEHAHLARPERLEPLARSLGLVPVRREQYLHLHPVRRTPEHGPPPAPPH